MSMKIICQNVNGIRAFHKKGQFDWLVSQNADIFCLQETKARPEQLSEEILNPDGYTSFFDWSKEKKGYSGTAIYIKNDILENAKKHKLSAGLGIKELDQEGRQVNLIIDNTAIINCYFPNGGGPISRQLYKQKYYDEFLNYLKKLEKKGVKNIIFCGDLNVAHNEIDIARPKENENDVGFLPEERMWIDEIIDAGYTDTFRELNQKIVKYSWWDMKTRARERNVGWRIDYFFVSKNLKDKVKKADILDHILGSDHAPIILEIE